MSVEEMQYEEVQALRADRKRMRDALLKIIAMNLQEAQDRYGDREQAESWSCVRVAREALA